MQIDKRGQSITEYAIMMGIIGSALLMMNVFFQRSIHLVIKEPVDNLGGFGSGMYRPQRIQEMGIEDNVIIERDGTPTVPQPYVSNSTFNSRKDIVTSSGGERRLSMNEQTTFSRRVSNSYQRIKYDQIRRP